MYVRALNHGLEDAAHAHEHSRLAGRDLLQARDEFLRGGELVHNVEELAHAHQALDPHCELVCNAGGRVLRTSQYRASRRPTVKAHARLQFLVYRRTPKKSAKSRHKRFRPTAYMRRSPHLPVSRHSVQMRGKSEFLKAE